MVANIGLDDLKNKLMVVEQEVDVKMKEMEVKQEKFTQWDKRVESLINQNDTLITLNIGGKIFQTKLSTLLSVKDTLFYKLLVLFDESNWKNQPLFFDRSYTYFPLILDYLRTKKFCLRGFGSCEIKDIKREVNYYGIFDISAEIASIQKEIEFIKWEGSPQFSNCGTQKVEDLHDRSLMTGICVQAPYTIIIELNFEHEIEAMEIAGWNGNPNAWYAGSGANATVSTSVDKIRWVDVGTIPANYGAIIERVSLRPSIVKWIKFQCTSYLGIGFLDLKKKR